MAHAVLIVALMAFAPWDSAAAADGVTLSAAEAREMAATGRLTLIDVRSPVEWRQTGVPSGALTITIHNPAGEAGFVDAVLAAVGGDRTQPIALICASGVRSHRAQQWLAENGFSDVVDIREGMLGRGDEPGWLERGLPVEPCRTC